MRAQSLWQLTAVRVNGARCGLHGVHRKVCLAYLREVQTGVHTICEVVETVGVVHEPVDGGARRGAALMNCVLHGTARMPCFLPCLH